MNLHEMLRKSREASGSVAKAARSTIDLDNIINRALTEGHIKPVYEYESTH